MAGLFERRWVKWGVGVSLALNLVVIGVLAGAAVRFSQSKPPEHVRGGFAMFSALAPDDRKALRKEMRAQDRSSRRAGREDMSELAEIVRAEVFDRDEAARLLAMQVQARHDVQSEIHTRWLDFVEGMTPEARVAYGERFQAHLERPRRKNKQ